MIQPKVNLHTNLDLTEKSYKSKGFLCFYSQTLKWQGQKNRSDSKFFKNPDFCCQSNSRKCMKAVFLLLNRRLLRGSDRKNRGFFRFCCFCSLKKQKKQGVESLFAVKGEKQGLGQGARYVAESPEAPEGLEMLKVVVGGEAASPKAQEGQEKTGRRDPFYR